MTARAELTREKAVGEFLRALIECGFKRTRYYEVDTQAPLTGLEQPGFEDLAVLAQKLVADGETQSLDVGFTIPWRNTALLLDGNGSTMVAVESVDFIARHPECAEWLDVLSLEGRAWFDLPIIRDGQTVGLVAADWPGESADLDEALISLLRIHGQRLGATAETPNTLAPLDIDAGDVETIVMRGCQDVVTRIDAMFGAVFRYDWRSNTLRKVGEFFAEESGTDCFAVEIDEPSYTAGHSYLTGRAWSDERYRYVASLDNLETKTAGWIEQGSRQAREGLSHHATKTVLYAVVGSQEQRYLLRFINRRDAPGLPFLRKRREIMHACCRDLQAAVDLNVSDRRIIDLRSIARLAVETIHEPNVTAKTVENAIHAEFVEDFMYVAFGSGTDEPTFVYPSGTFKLVAGKAADIVASIQRKEMQHVQKLPDSAGQFEVRTASAEDTPITEMRDRLEDYLWLDSQAGDTTGILLTTIVGSPPVMTRVNGELRLLQTYCDLLTSSIEAMATYISRDGAHRALGYIGHEIGTPFIIMAESAELITQNNMELAEQIREFYPALASDVLRTARSNHRLIGRQRDEIDRVMSVAPLLANMGSGELSMYVDEADIGSVFREARDRLQTETFGIQPSGSTAKGLGRRRFAIKITDSMSRLPIVACDEGLILQVAINLLRNAVKYSLPRHPPEPMIVTVSGRSIDDRMCAVTIENWGFGIPEEVQSRIFLPFVRGQVEDRLKSLPGMGIGLYLVSTIMAAHGGSVSCRSVPTLHDPKRTEALEGWLTAFELRFRRDLPIGPRTAEIRSASSLGARQRGVHIRVGH